MTWARIDDAFWRHRKYSGASLAATGLQARSLSYCNDQLNDGHVTMADLVRIAPEARQKDRLELAAELVSRGVWEENAAGWYIHDFPVYNKTRAEVEAERAEAKERMANVRANRTRTRAEPPGPVRETFNDPVPVPVPNKPKPLAAIRPRDELFEVIVEVCGWSLDSLTRDARGRTNGAAKQLREVGADPPLVRGFGDLWAEKYPGAPLTPQALTNNWPDYMAGKLWPEVRRRR